MEIKDSGVLPPSFMDFTLPSTFARDALYYVPQFGHFYCDNEYRISRESLDLYLLIFLYRGSLRVQTDGRDYLAQAGQIVLLDCRRPHAYSCPDTAEFLWLHFDGNNSAQYANLLRDQFGAVFSGTAASDLCPVFEQIFFLLQTAPVNEHLLSLHLCQILSRLASPEKAAAGNPLIAPAIRHIRHNFQQSIPLSVLAAACSMSQSHFIRSFQRYTGCTPHEYLLSYRLRQAKLLLRSTADSVEEIADECGFNSASHFARAFRKESGMSPTAFRQIQF